jgi:hypothetical protein
MTKVFHPAALCYLWSGHSVTGLDASRNRRRTARSNAESGHGELVQQLTMVDVRSANVLGGHLKKA